MNTFYAVPGSMWPGAIWPGDAALLPPVPVAPAAVFTYGEPYFEWETGTPYFGWETGNPHFEWATGDPRLS